MEDKHCSLHMERSGQFGTVAVLVTTNATSPKACIPVEDFSRCGTPSPERQAGQVGSDSTN